MARNGKKGNVNCRGRDSADTGYLVGYASMGQTLFMALDSTSLDHIYNHTMNLYISNKIAASELCMVAETCKKMKTVAEKAAEIACKRRGRVRVNQGSWRQVLACPAIGMELKIGPNTGDVTCVANLGNGRVVSGSGDTSLRVWDSETGKCLKEFHGHPGAVCCVADVESGRVVSGSR